MFEELKAKWNKGYVSIDTMRGWVRLNKRNSLKGITESQYKEITGEDYED